jgi:hypothetical protein
MGDGKVEASVGGILRANPPCHLDDSHPTSIPIGQNKTGGIDTGMNVSIPRAFQDISPQRHTYAVPTKYRELCPRRVPKRDVCHFVANRQISLIRPIICDETRHIGEVGGDGESAGMHLSSAGSGHPGLCQTSINRRYFWLETADMQYMILCVSTVTMCRVITEIGSGKDCTSRFQTRKM